MARICQALNLPRVSLIGILQDVPIARTLIELVREVVPVLGVPWLDEVKQGGYLGVKINALETPVGVGRK